MSPRIILLTLAGILIYLVLSLYHGHQLRQLPDPNSREKTASLSAADQEENWVQITTSPEDDTQRQKQPVSPVQPPIADSSGGTVPVTPQTAVTPEAGPDTHGRDDSLRQLLQTAGEEQARLQQTLAREQENAKELAIEKDNLQFKINALQANLQETRAMLRTKEEELKESRDKRSDHEIETLKKSIVFKTRSLEKANARIDSLAQRNKDASAQLVDAGKTISELHSALEMEQKARQQAEQTTLRLKSDADLSKKQAQEQLAETGRLHAQVKQMGSRLILLEEENKQAHLKAEAMLRYGQEQTKLTDPFRQEIEILNARLEDANTNHVQMEQTIAELKETEQGLRKQIQQLQGENRNHQDELIRLEDTGASLLEAKARNDELTAMLKELADQINEREARIAMLTKTATEVQAQHREAEQKAAILEGNSARLQEEKQNSLNHAQSLQAERDGLQKKMAELKRENIRKKNELASARSESAGLKASLNNNAKELRAAQTRQKEKDALIVSLKQKIKAVEKKADRSRERAQQLQEKDAQLTALKQELSESAKRINSGEKRLQETTAAVTAQKDENKRLSDELSLARQEGGKLEALIGELAEKDDLLKRMQEAATSLKSELDSRERAYFTLQEELSSLQLQHDKLLLQTTDSDNDGVPDSRDTCPETENNAMVNNQGCEKDTDSDGILDRLDLCPDSPEATDTDRLGCQPDRPVILRSVSFESGTAELSGKAAHSLDKLVAILQQSPSLNIEIGGHTDSVGEEQRNLTVSRQRAEAVAGYLVNNGIGQDRVTATGYGPLHPVADNDTHAGRAANRRVELKIIAPGQE